MESDNTFTLSQQKSTSLDELRMTGHKGNSPEAETELECQNKGSGSPACRFTMFWMVDTITDGGGNATHSKDFEPGADEQCLSSTSAFDPLIPSM